MTRDSDIAVEVLGERHRQDEKWGEQNHPDGTGLTEVLDRVPVTDSGYALVRYLRQWATSRCDRAAVNGEVTWQHILLEEVFEALAEDDPVKLRTELIQVSAVAQQWVGAIDRRAA